MFINKNKDAVIFAVFVAVYAMLFVIQPALGPNDDFVFLRTLQEGKPLVYFSGDFPYYDIVKLGRFTPLGALEYNIFNPFSKDPSPFWYFLIHALEFIAFIFLFVRILCGATKNRALAYAVSFLLFLHPAFAISWFRLQLGERNVALFLGALVLASSAFLARRKSIYAIIGLLSANAALYTKELAFLSVGAFAASYLLLRWKLSLYKEKLYNGLLIASSAFYLILYFFLIYQNSEPFVLKARPHNFFLVLLKGIANYAFFSDPIIIFILIPLAIQRVYLIAKRKATGELPWDAMIAGACVYALTLIALNIYGPYYMLPVYIMALPPIIYYLKSLMDKTAWKILVVTTGIIMITNTLPAGLHYITFNKYTSLNFNKALEFLKNGLVKNQRDGVPSIFLDGVNLNTGRGTYFIFAEFMRYKGISEDKFDLKSNTPSRAESVVSKIQHRFTVFESDELSEIAPGDYLVLTPQRTERTSRAHLSALLKNPEYKLVFRTKSPLSFPNVSLKSLIKTMVLKRIGEKQKAQGLVVNEITLEDPDYYVFLKR